MIKPPRKIFTVSDITPAYYNPRKISTKQKAGLKKSLDRFGYLQDIIVNVRGGLNIIVGGHKRLETMGLPVGEEIECTVVDLSPIEEKALNVALNNRHTSGEYDQDGLGKILLELKEDWAEGFDDLNFDDLAVEFDFDLSGDDEPPGDGDKLPEVPKSVIIKRGDLAEIGGHRVLCGDSTDLKDVENLMKGERADMVFTDPPYFVGVSSTGMKISMPDRENMKHMFDAITDKIFKFCKGHWYFCTDWRTYPVIYERLLSKSRITNCIVWDFEWIKAGSQYRFTHEFIIFGDQENKKQVPRGDSDVWRIKAVNFTVERLHGAEKPVELSNKAILNSSEINGSVLDLFLGSGSTLISCEKTNRRCYGMELDEKYCQVIIQRWADYTGRDDIKINGEPVSWREYSAATQ